MQIKELQDRQDYPWLLCFAGTIRTTLGSLCNIHDLSSLISTMRHGSWVKHIMTFRMVLAYYMVKYPWQRATAVPAGAHFNGYFNSLHWQTMLSLCKYSACDEWISLYHQYIHTLTQFILLVLIIIINSKGDAVSWLIQNPISNGIYTEKKICSSDLYLYHHPREPTQNLTWREATGPSSNVWLSWK